jgi:hypothetical protein
MEVGVCSYNAARERNASNTACPDAGLDHQLTDRFTHNTIIGYRYKNRTSHLFNIQDLAQQQRTCYEPLASTHPDTQGAANV